ncbi:hypothetical protein DOY81_007035, partial [Sarcophaga bullata]
NIYIIPDLTPIYFKDRQHHHLTFCKQTSYVECKQSTITPETVFKI